MGRIKESSLKKEDAEFLDEILDVSLIDLKRLLNYLEVRAGKKIKIDDLPEPYLRLGDWGTFWKKEQIVSFFSNLEEKE
jgi:hypothetical protein